MKIRQFLVSNKFLIVILFLIGFLVNVSNLKNQMFWDDKAFIFDNIYVHSLNLENLKTIFTTDILEGSRAVRRLESESNYYRPLLLLSFAVNYVIHGEEVLGYHLVNNLIHVANGILVFYLLFKLFNNKWISFFTSLIFLINPIQTEGVTYVSGRGDLMAYFFMLLILAIYTKFSKCKYLWVYGSIFYALALLSREIAIVFPGLFIIYIFVLNEKKIFKKTIPYILILAVYLFLRVTILNFGGTFNFHPGQGIYYESTQVRLITFIPIIFEYLSLIFYPRDLHVRFETKLYTSIFNPVVFICIIALFGIAIFIYNLYKKSHPDFKIWIFGVVWFFVNLVPTSGIVAINASMQEHWVYMALVGPVLIFVHYISKLFFNKKSVLVSIILALIYLGYLFWYTGVRNYIWSDPLLFFEDYRSYEVGNARILNNMGTYYSTMKNDLVKAEDSYRKAINFNPDFAEPYYNLGNLLGQTGREQEGIAMHKKAIEIEPTYPKPYEVLAYYFESKGDFNEAIKYWKILTNITPDDDLVFYNLGVLSYKTGDKNGARNYLENVLKISSSQKLTSMAKELLIKLRNEGN